MVNCVSACCVSCSLANEYLVPINKCRHSSSPIFNRTKRGLWDILPEDVSIPIYKEAIHKEIIEASRGDYQISETLYHPQRNYRFQKEKDIQSQVCNEYESNFPRHKYRYKCRSDAVIVHYNQIKRAKIIFRSFFKGLIRRRVVNESTYILKYRHADVNQKTLKSILICDISLFNLQRLKPLNTQFDDLRKNYDTEVCPVRVNTLKRLRVLYNEEPDNLVKMWYLLKIGQLCMTDNFFTDTERSTEYHFLGTQVSLRVGYWRNPLYPNRPKYTAKEFYDLPQFIYRVFKYDPVINWRDCYSNKFNREWGLMIQDDKRIPAVSTKKLKTHMKKVFIELYDYHLTR